MSAYHKRQRVFGKLFRTCLLAAALATSACAGPSVEPIDIHNPVISAESRRFVADAQDAVSIAKSGVNEAQRQLDETKTRRKKMLAADSWKKMSKSTLDQFKKLLDARVHLAELRLDRAEAELALAQAKLTEVYAETAVRHDLETYQLEPIRNTVDQRLDAVRQAKQKIGAYLPTIDEVSRAWWKTYNSVLKDKKHPDVFFATATKIPESPFHIEKKADEDAQKGDEKDAKKTAKTDKQAKPAAQ